MRRLLVSRLRVESLRMKSLCDDARKAGLDECLPDPSGTACLRARAEQTEVELERLRTGIGFALESLDIRGQGRLRLLALLEKPDA